jgi:predicted AlkP superfamily phosphohydrolase/phosphomutase
MVNKVYVIGVDGGTLDLLGLWMQQGQLPHLRQLMETGVSGPLGSTIPPMTATAWSSFMTGKNAGKHGIYDFGMQMPGGYGYKVIDSRFRRGKTLWEIIGDHGGTVAVLNVPGTYPPKAVNGVLGGDFLTPSGSRDFLYPPELLVEIEQRFGAYPLYAVPPYFAVTQADADIDRFIREYEAALRYTFDVAHYLLDKIAPQFLMLHLFGNDQICHWLWHILDETHPQHQRQGAEKLLGRVLDYYRGFDAALGGLMRRCDRETAFIVMSDHGFGPLHKVINLNTWLIREGYLALKQTPITQLRYLVWRLGVTPETLARSRLAGLLIRRFVKKIINSDQGTIDKVKKFHAWQQLFLSLNDVDWQRTKAFCLFGWGQIKINVKGKYPHGTVSPGAEHSALQAEIVGKLQELRDPETGEKVGGPVFAKHEIYTGECVDDAPDITFLPLARNYWANSRGTGFASHKVFSSYLWGMTGMHRMDGMLIASGPGLRRGGRISGGHLMDLFPSILYLLGLPIPRDIDGRVLEELFEADFLQANAVRFGGEAPENMPGSTEVSSAEQAELIERLRDLGYL